MTDLRPGVIVTASGGHYTVQQHGATSAMPVSYLIGPAPSVNQLVLWAVIEGKVLVLAYSGVS